MGGTFALILVNPNGYSVAIGTKVRLSHSCYDVGLYGLFMTWRQEFMSRQSY